MKWRWRAIDGQQYGVVVFVHIYFQVLQIAVLVGQLSGIAVGRDGFAYFLLGHGALLIEYSVFGFVVQAFG